MPTWLIKSLLVPGMVLAGFSYAIQKDDGDKKSENPFPHSSHPQTPSDTQRPDCRRN